MSGSTAAATACAAAAVVAGTLVGLASRSAAQGLHVLLDLLLAAALLLLTGRPGWAEIALVAALLGVRALVVPGASRAPGPVRRG